MRIQRRCKSCSAVLLLSFTVILNGAAVLAQNKSKYACDEAQPENMCNAANTCGSASSQCMIDVTRSGDSSNVKPEIPSAKDNQLFCIKAGTTVVWKSRKKNTGFLVSFGPDSPFGSDNPIRGGGKKAVTTVAKMPGCYKYDVGAFISGTVYGMSGGNKSEVVILP